VVLKALGEERKISKNGGEYWMARDIQSVMGYSRWESFEKTVQRARQSCESAGVEPGDHFREATKMIEVGKGAMVPTQDIFLTRYACYLVAMNGDPKLCLGVARF
jgi:DNA-damage-inducible protein D